ncbi:MAG TPA: lipase maturation factor family protein, partial [Terriglobales bacterium]
FAYFATPAIAAIAGLITLFFHGWLMVSGNFSFLGLLTMVLATSTLNDKLLSKILRLAPRTPLQFPRYFQYTVLALAAVVGYLSIRPVQNLISPSQAMNTSYDSLHLVNSYGAFGTITRPRYEVIVEGTDEPAITPQTLWREYEFRGKPATAL